MVSASRRTRALGQNFLVDRNILDVIERLAELSGDDVVLEIGGGNGVLSERLAQHVGHLHVVEVDERLEPRLRNVLAPFDNVTLHLADALALDLAALHPAPTKVVANLPYGIAATVILRTIDELPTVHSWVAMVQREVGERLAAAPATPAYGAPSVLAQLACEVKVLRAVGAGRVSPGAQCGLGARGPAPAWPRRRTRAAARRLVHEAFAHRRKTLAGSLALAPGARRDPRTGPSRAGDARAPARRARRTALARGVPRAGREARPMKLGRARRPRSTCACSWRPVRGDGRHELVTLFESVSLADELVLARSTRGPMRSRCPGVPGPIWSRRLSMASGAGWAGARGTGRDREANPRRRGNGWRVGRRRRRAANAPTSGSGLARGDGRAAALRSGPTSRASSCRDWRWGPERGSWPRPFRRSRRHAC